MGRPIKPSPINPISVILPASLDYCAQKLQCLPSPLQPFVAILAKITARQMAARNLGEKPGKTDFVQDAANEQLSPTPFRL
jgi:hypothetical protein